MSGWSSQRSSKQMLPSGDENLSAGDIAEIRAAELKHGGCNLVRGAHAMHRDARNEALVFRSDHGRLYLTRRHRVDAHAKLGKIDGHLAGKRRQRSLGGAIGRTCEGVDRMTRYGGDVDDSAAAAM